DDGMRFVEPETAVARYAFLGVRPCDLRAIAVQDRVLGVGSTYAARRRELFLIAVNCTEPSATCFCVSAGGGPTAETGYDIALTELTDSDRPPYVAGGGSAAGRPILAALPQSPAEQHVIDAAHDAVAAAAGRMGRALTEVDLR